MSSARVLLILGVVATGCGGGGGSADAPPGGGDGPSGAVDAPSARDLDPAPERTTPGEYTCPGCPDTETTVFELNGASATAYSFSGVVAGAEGNGRWYVEGPDGEAIGGTIPTSGGSYNFTAPIFCGETLVKCTWDNASGRYVLVQRVITTDCIDPDIRVTIVWDDQGDDWELHLVKPGGTINDNATDCTWTSCISSQPDWGVVGDATDNPKKDIDNTGTYGPENVFLSSPEAGEYTVFVEHWGGGTPSAGRAIFNVNGAVTIVDITNFLSHHVWTAGTITWPGGAVATTHDDYDCTANWSGGCRDPLPQ